MGSEALLDLENKLRGGPFTSVWPSGYLVRSRTRGKLWEQYRTPNSLRSPKLKVEAFQVSALVFLTRAPRIEMALVSIRAASGRPAGALGGGRPVALGAPLCFGWGGALPLQCWHTWPGLEERGVTDLKGGVSFAS